MPEALDHALAQGLLGVDLSHAPGRELSDPAYEPSWARAEETGAILFLHPFEAHARPASGPVHLSNTVGQPTENAVALDLIFSGCWTGTPGSADRGARRRLSADPHRPSDHAWSACRTPWSGCAHLPSSYLKRLYFDSLVHDPHVLREAGPGRRRRPGVLPGFDFPFDMGTEDPVAALRAARLPEADFHAVRGRQRRRPPEEGLTPCVCSPI
ncbi:Amidohydrolase OS=Streptomyces fumanus OX=67302 GN=GCM10018772_17620 PE=4 SV=1 [Streptomyces fumanus]